MPTVAPSVPDPAPAARTDAERWVRRHALPTRLWHWLNAVAIIVLIGSGAMIFNAHPRLYWGEYGANFDHAWLELPRFAGWFTIPQDYNLALGRRWHLFFALVLGFGLLGYMITSLFNRHFRRDLRLRAADLAPAHVAADLRAHLHLRFHDPERPGDYNLFQKLSYIAVIFGLIPLAILSGLALSPGMNAAWPWLLELFGGRQSARSVHFMCFGALTLFTVVHLALVILAGAWNEVRSMLTGKWRVPE